MASRKQKTGDAEADSAAESPVERGAKRRGQELPHDEAEPGNEGDDEPPSERATPERARQSAAPESSTGSPPSAPVFRAPPRTKTPDELSEEAEALAALGVELSDESVLEQPERLEAEASAAGLDQQAQSPSGDDIERDGAPAHADDAGTEDTTTYLKGLVEAILFVSDRPLELRDVARAARLDKKRAQELLAMLVQDTRERGIRVEEVAGGYAFRTNPAYSANVRGFLQQRPVRLSRAQIETLAIVAYRQPITRPEVDDIRGVDSGPVLKGLLERDLVRIIGKKDEPGRPMLYGTTPAFLEAFSLRSLRDLPTLREYTELTDESRQAFEQEIGEAPPEGPLNLRDEPDGDFPASRAEPQEPYPESSRPGSGEDGELMDEPVASAVTTRSFEDGEDPLDEDPSSTKSGSEPDEESPEPRGAEDPDDDDEDESDDDDEDESDDDDEDESDDDDEDDDEDESDGNAR